jgi:hypothetical protein
MAYTHQKTSIAELMACAEFMKPIRQIMRVVKMAENRCDVRELSLPSKDYE